MSHRIKSKAREDGMSHKLGKSNDDVYPFDKTRTQTQLEITMVRFA